MAPLGARPARRWRRKKEVHAPLRSLIFLGQLPIREGVMLRTRFLFVAAFSSLLLAGPANAGPTVTPLDPVAFPAPPGLEPDIRFWERVYTEVDTGGGLIHDSRDLSVVYEVTRIPDGLSRRGRERHTEGRKKHYRTILRKLAQGARSGLSTEEARVLSLFPDGVSNQTLSDASRRLRFQLGQADKFKAGLIRSGAYLDHIHGILREMDLPLQIAALPHVESSFTPHAYSRVGAAGLWQFTRSTGRRFMQVDHVVDERLDPYRATYAAARLLEQNRRVTGAWPLAVTAYNHGAAGMRRAVRKLGTQDITTIVRGYKSRTFGFASRNFYVEFLAASRVAANPEKYFGPLVMNEPQDYDRMEMPYYAPAKAIADALGVDMASFKRSNPALRSSVWQGAKHVPRGFEIKIPRALLPRPMSVALGELPAAQQHARQTRDSYHVVRRGETLSAIARRYGVRMSELQALNNLRSRHRIRVGQKLRLPTEGARVKRAAIAPAAPVLPQAAPPDGLYTVRRGDTLSKIATRFGMAEQALIDANGLRNRHRIYVGQVLRVSTAIDQALVVDPEDASERLRDAHPQALALLTPSRAGEPAPRPSEATARSEAEAQKLDEADRIARSEEIPLDAVPLEEVEVEVLEESSTDSPAVTPGGEGPTLLADPSDYTVAADGTIEVQPKETLGHYAEWLGLRAHRLRAINGLRFGEHVVVNHRLKLEFSEVTPEQFERLRLEFHRGMQEDFFARFEIDGTETHRIRRGDSLWILSHRRFNVPVWLLRQYNPDVDFEALSAGTRITVPVLREREDDRAGEGAVPLTRTAELS